MKLQAFSTYASGGVCFYLQAVMKSVSVKIQDFILNCNNDVYYVACFYLHAMVVCF